MFDHIERNNGVIFSYARWERLGEVRFKQFPLRAVQSFQNPSGDVETVNVVAVPFQHLEIDSPTTARVQDVRRGANIHSLQQGKHQAGPSMPPRVTGDDICQVREDVLRHTVIGQSLGPCADHR